jgi:Fe-S cluster assembly iron-binding protein IscA
MSGASGFGASAFVDIYNLKVENGITPEGQEYNAIANDLRATHVALAPHVRDPENKIKVTNAVCVRNTGEMMEVENAEGDDMEISDERIKAIVKNMAAEMVEEMRATARNIRTAAEITWSNGDVTRTDVNGTEETVRSYYKIGQEFNIGSGGKDKIVKVKSVKILK